MTSDYINGVVDTLDEMQNVIRQSLARYGRTDIQGVIEAFNNMNSYLNIRSSEVQAIIEAIESPTDFQLESIPHLTLAVDNTKQGGR